MIKSIKWSLFYESYRSEYKLMFESSLSYAFYKKSPEIVDYMPTADRADSEFDNFEGFNNVNIERSSIIDISI